MALSTEKICELKQIIHSHLSQNIAAVSQVDIQSHIRQIMEDSMNNIEQGQVEPLSGDHVIKALRDRGVVDNVLRQLRFNQGPPDGSTNGVSAKRATHFVNSDDKLIASEPVQKANIDPTRRHLCLQFLGGKAFLEHLQEPEPLSGHVTSTFTLHIHFRGQRFRSRSIPCACDPDFKETFLLELHKEAKGDASRMLDKTSLLSLSDNVHIVLIKCDASGEKTLVSSHHLEWRPLLAAPSSRCSLSLQMMGIGSESKVPVGVVDVKLELLPRLADNLTDEVITTQITLEKTRQAERERLYLVYAKQWWKEYLEIRAEHKHRLVKIFAQDENGITRPSCSFVCPLRSGRLLHSPRQASRFVALLGYEKAVTVGGGERAELWTATHSFLCRTKGDCEDHAVLLCSLLLGFGLDAYVCVGTKSRGAVHCWVVTLDVMTTATFWESLTGHRYSHIPIELNDPPATRQPKPTYPYKTIGCMFNHEHFYANSQPTDAVELCTFDIADESRWKAMSSDAIRSVCGQDSAPKWPTPAPLCASLISAGLVSNDLEQQLQGLVAGHRRDQGLTTMWDDHLSYLLTPALAAYETERLTGLTTGNEEFQQAIRRAVPDGHTFKGYPIQFIHRNAHRIFAACLKNAVFDEIVNCRGDHVRLALRVCVYTYPEDVCATWIMFACKYKSVL